MTSRYCIVVACNDDECLERNLLSSDLVTKRGVQVHVERGAPSASIAYNRGLDATDAPYVIFAHQDVYFPPNWESLLDAAIEKLDQMDPNWALVAPYGVAKDGSHHGWVWSTGWDRAFGAPVETPHPVESFDELTIILRRDSGLRFDEKLPLYHMYGTDIVQIARAAGRTAYVAHLPAVHNDGFHGKLGSDFAKGYHYIRRKWRAVLPLESTVLPIKWHGLNMLKFHFWAWRSYKRREKSIGDNSVDPSVYSKKMGWE